MSDIDKCPFCGHTEFEDREVEYLYCLRGKHLLVPRMPSFVCLNCLMEFYSGRDLEEVERRFFAIHDSGAPADRYETMPIVDYA
ncbi:MAG: YgiT-type zinc finger protein [Chloroflexi bacterium]|nr:YgiT-type zinc finger protein [Chloroflexota bacterium]